MKAQSLNPTQSTIFWGMLQRKFKMYNRHRKQDGLKEVSFEYFCICFNVDLSGKTVIDVHKNIFV